MTKRRFPPPWSIKSRFHMLLSGALKLLISLLLPGKSVFL